MSSTMNSTLQRRRLLVQGIIQGVGFRPFAYAQARLRHLVGFVYNDSQGVTIEVEGSVTDLDGFQQALSTQAPLLARVDSVLAELIPLCYEHTFTITHSQKSVACQALIASDSAICSDCLHELFDPADQRYHYPFINCTNCGPRFTIAQDVPYDRDKTTMHVFPMCSSCQAEYEDPLDRRFHAQPNACPLCGPQLRFLAWDDLQAMSAVAMPLDEPPDAMEPWLLVAQRLAQGAIIAIKGLGGYHLACDASQPEVVQRLRQRKQREAKPFALMVADIETARLLCEVSEAEAALLQAHRRPIVLLKQHSAAMLAPEVAASSDTLAIMLPYTPLHYLLLRAFAARVGPERLAILVMTSGNLSDEPIAYRDEEAQKRLIVIADGMLTHNRVIHMRCDDSVVRIVAGAAQIFRRARGYAPEPITLATELPLHVLACGGHLKNTFCLGKGQQAFVSQHIGDLANLETLTSFREGIEHFQRLFAIAPQAIAYDLHPEYLATKYALDSAIPRKIAVQHHHAHIASVLAEHGLSESVIGVAADGTGFGTDNAIWGCEILLADCVDFVRLAHLTYVALPGGQQAISQPWRMAAAYLAQAYGSAFQELAIPFVRQLDRSKWHVLEQMMARGINCPPTSSLGRLFDAVAALLGLRTSVQYEGQAAIELEMLASKAVQPYPFELQRQAHEPTLLNVTPMIRAIVDDIAHGLPSAQIAGRFHLACADLLAAACVDAREQTGVRKVALSGGVFQNRLLLETLIVRLESRDFQVYINRRVPSNDGGISLGQLAVASARLQRDL